MWSSLPFKLVRIRLYLIVVRVVVRVTTVAAPVVSLVVTRYSPLSGPHILVILDSSCRVYQLCNNVPAVEVEKDVVEMRVVPMPDVVLQASYKGL